MLWFGVFNIAFSQAEEVEAIKGEAERFSAFLVNGDHQGLVSIYTSDAKIFPGNRLILEGEELENYWKPNDNSQTIYHKITPEEVKIFGNEAYDWGYYEGKSQNSDGNVSSWKGKYVVVWRKEEGQWKMYLDIWNRVRE